MALHTFHICIQPTATFTHPSGLFGRIADHEGMLGNISCHYRTCTDEGVAADGVAANDGAVGSQGGAFSDEGGADLIHPADFRPGVVDVCEDH